MFVDRREAAFAIAGLVGLATHQSVNKLRRQVNELARTTGRGG